MAQRNYKVTVTERDYRYTTYTCWVTATSRDQAVLKAGALAGQEKNRREFERMKRVSDLWPGGLLEPSVTVTVITSLDEFWDKRGTVEVTET